MPVIDASTVLAFLFPDEDGTMLEQILTTHEADDVVAPSLLDLEILNAILLHVRGNRFSADVGAGLIEDVSRLPIRRIEPDAGTFAALVPIAERNGLTAYDALYLALARTRGLPLATNDRRLRVAARAEGVPTLP